MVPPTGVNSPETLLLRIDAIVNEVQVSRQSVQALLAARTADPVHVGGLPSVLEIVQNAPGQRVFQQADDVVHTLQEERAAWV